MSDRVLLDNGQQNDNGDDQDVEVNSLGIGLAEPAADSACRIRGREWTRGPTAGEKDRSRDGVAETVDQIYYVSIR